MTSTDTAIEEVESANADSAARITLPPRAEIHVLHDLWQQCQEALVATDDLTFDCAAVEWIDAAVLQSVGALAAEVRRQGRTVHIVERTPAFDEAVATLGLGPLLDGDAEPAADEGP
ncbi:MAG: STAS domain-containing protein [Actinomycetota bacterium]